LDYPKEISKKVLPLNPFVEQQNILHLKFYMSRDMGNLLIGGHLDALLMNY
jgi:hypothetical protein